jgi:hypothetical protein
MSSSQDSSRPQHPPPEEQTTTTRRINILWKFLIVASQFPGQGFG